MTAKILADADGHILHREGDVDAVYGIASLSKIWAAVLMCDRMREIAAKKKHSLENILDGSISITVDYEPKIYHRPHPRPDLSPPDDALTYQPFRAEKKRFRLPVEKSASYKIRALFAAALGQSKNDAIQALADHFFADDDNKSFRIASAALAQKLALTQTKIGDPHGLCDGDNVTTAREWLTFCAYIINSRYMDFFALFDPAAIPHTAQELMRDDRLTQKNIKILLAKTATGNDRYGNDNAHSLMAIARQGDQFRIAVTLSDENPSASIIDMLLTHAIKK